MEEKNNELKIESGVFGEGAVVFGGKVNGLVYSTYADRPNVVIGFRELDKVYNIGAEPDEVNRDVETQIHLVFDNVESIDIVREWLDCARELLIEDIKESKQKEVSNA